jgi:hypothetical protein
MASVYISGLRSPKFKFAPASHVKNRQQNHKAKTSQPSYIQLSQPHTVSILPSLYHAMKRRTGTISRRSSLKVNISHRFIFIGRLLLLGLGWGTYYYGYYSNVVIRMADDENDNNNNNNQNHSMTGGSMRRSHEKIDTNLPADIDGDGNDTNQMTPQSYYSWIVTNMIWKGRTADVSVQDPMHTSTLQLVSPERQQLRDDDVEEEEAPNSYDITNDACTIVTPTSLRQHIIEYIYKNHPSTTSIYMDEYQTDLLEVLERTSSTSQESQIYWSLLQHYSKGTIITPTATTHHFDQNRSTNILNACTDPPGLGWEGGHGAYQLLHFKIQISSIRPGSSSSTSSRSFFDPTTTELITDDISDAQQQQLEDEYSDPIHNRHHPANDIKLLCAIYTHEPRHTLLRMAALTWGLQCDGFIAFTTSSSDSNGATTTTTDTTVISDLSTSSVHYRPGNNLNNSLLGIVSIPHHGIESYANMWQKTRAIWKYIHTHYSNEYDYIHLSGDDTYIIVPNLKYFLYIQQLQLENIGSTQVPEPQPMELFAGQWIRQKYSPYVGGGPGYTISRSVLQQFIQYAYDECYPDTTSSSEDRYFSLCIQKYTNITLTDTRDVDTGEQTYHDVAPQQVYDGRPSHMSSRAIPSFHSRALSYYETLPYPYSRYRNDTNATAPASNEPPWLPIVSNNSDDRTSTSTTLPVGPKYGLNAAAKYSISFHKVSHPLLMLRIHTILYPSLCETL